MDQQESLRAETAAQAILSCGASELLDPEAHLTTTFGYPLAIERPPIHEAVVAMAGSSTLSELQSGVSDYKERVIRRVSITNAGQWRSSTEGKWVKDMLNLMGTEIPGFGSWYTADKLKRRGPVPRLRGKQKSDFLASTACSEWVSDLVVACHRRALLGAKPGPHLTPSASTVPPFLSAIDAVSAYCAVYTQYLVRLLTDGALPERNDSGDLEILLYSVDDDHLVVTSERKWASLAERAGYPGRVLSV
jgi:hypothetical protein